MKKIYLLIAVLLLCKLNVMAQSGLGEIRGKILDSKTKKPLDYVSVTLKLNGVTKASTLTDDEGGFVIKTLQPGAYDLFSSYIGYLNQTITNINVTADEIRFVNFNMTKTEAGETLKEVVIEYKKPLVDPGGVKGDTKTSKEIMSLGTRNFNAIAGTTLGVESRNGSTPNFRGARAEGTAYYIDGVRVQAGSINVPQNAIDQIQVITGGTPAQYGDFVGGAISITTKAPTKHFQRAFEGTTASPFNGYLDYSHYNQFQTVLSGPIKIINKGRGDQEKVLLGFLISGAVTYSRDGNQPAVDLYKVKDDKLDELKNRPLVPGPGGTLFYAGEFLRKTDLERVNFRQNVASYSGQVNGNFNYQPSDNINVRLGYFGNFNRGRNYSHYHSLLNADNNGMNQGYTGRVFLQFTQTFKKKNEDREAAKTATISNAFYTARLSYEVSYSETMNSDFMRDYFSYGHIGKFTTYQAPTYTRRVKDFQSAPDSFRMENGNYIYLTNYYAQTNWVDTSVTFEQGPHNKVRGNYTQNVYDYYGQRSIRNANTIRSLNGLINGDNPNGLYSNMWGNVGQLSATSYSKGLAETYTAYVMSEFSVAPKSNPKAKHDLQFGMTFEQQFRRNYGLGANGLWTLMRLITNRQFAGLAEHPDSAILKFDQNGVFQDTVWFNRRVVASDQSYFDKNLRDALINNGATDANGKPIDKYTFLDVNSYNPSTFKMNMFSADELLNNGNSYVSYSGYDHLGNIVRGKPNLNDFLNRKDENGNFVRWLPAYQPNYFAAWAQDKFVFKDLVIRLGMRIERFDANQPVLRDPYSMVPVLTAGEVKNSSKSNLQSLKDQIPAVIGDDYVVYVNKDPDQQSQSGMSIAGYRSGNSWFDKNGNPISDPQQIAKDGGTNRNIPLLVDPSEAQKPTAASFRDYTPDVKVLPRVWFSFPISTTSQFFGTYDILTQRPSANVGQIDDYFFLQNRLSGGAINNPDLKMTQVTDYEIGFRQQIGTDAALGLIASYREYRNMVQLFPYIQAWPNTYNTFGNLDFATVKSIGVEYNIRDLGNVTLNANYQMQFADGTGSNATSSSSLINVGLPSLRTIFPLDFDTRHTFKAIFDYHYKDGKDYDGPVVGGKNILENAGFNFVFTAYSGRPYTQNLLPTPDGVQSGVVVRSPIKGTINGANLPPQYNVDLNIDKNFMFKKKKIDGSMTVYRLRTFLWVQNLFNAANVTGVFRYTGSAYNDGFIASPQAQEQIRTATNQQSYIDLYNTRMLNPDRFMLPRLTRLGVALYF